MQSYRTLVRVILFGSTMLLLSISPARAAFVVDTGAPTATSGSSFYSLDSNQWLAGRFTLADAWNLNSVEGWITNGGNGVSGTVHASIYADNAAGPLPTGTALYSSIFTFNAPANCVDLYSCSAWDGAYGLDWALLAGTYWLGFEVQSGDTLVFGSMQNDVPSPLSNYANTVNGSVPVYVGTFSTGVGMRIDATLSPVPVPAAVWLFGTALVGLVGFGKRRKAA